MKKISALIIVLVMCIMLAACGEKGPDRQPAIDALNEVSVPFGEVCNIVEGDVDSYPEALVEELAEITEGMTAYKALLEGDEEMTEDDIADATEWLGYVKERVAEIKTEYDI